MKLFFVFLTICTTLISCAHEPDICECNCAQEPARAHGQSDFSHDLVHEVPDDQLFLVSLRLWHQQRPTVMYQTLWQLRSLCTPQPELEDPFFPWSELIDFCADDTYDSMLPTIRFVESSVPSLIEPLETERDVVRAFSSLQTTCMTEVLMAGMHDEYAYWPPVFRYFCEGVDALRP